MNNKELAAVKQAKMVFSMMTLADNFDWVRHQAGVQREALQSIIEQQPAADEPVARAKAIAECAAVLRPLVKRKFPHEQALEELIEYTRPRPAAPAIPEGWMKFVQRVAQQKPEKPDYWNSCGQCEHNINDAEDLLAAAPEQKGN